MKRDLKMEILLTADRLFNESGCQAVSMRKIAEALGISVGNLTYHYKRKEDLMEAVMKMHHEKCRALPPPSTLPELDRFFRSLLEKQEHRRGMAFEIHGKQDTARILELQRLAFTHIAELLSGALDALEATGLLQKDPAREAVEQALLGMLLFGCTREWIHGISGTEETRKYLWQLLDFLLTPKGKQELKQIILEA